MRKYNKVGVRKYVKMGEQLGDILSKILNGARINYLYNKLAMVDLFSPAGGECYNIYVIVYSRHLL